MDERHPAQIALNDTAYGKPEHTITIKNTSNKVQKYKITHVPAGTMNPFDSHQQAIHPVPLDNHYAKVTFKPSTIEVQPGKSAKFVATINPPTGVNSKIFPVYSGFLKVASADDSVHVSYMGVVGKMKDMKIWDRTSDCKCWCISPCCEVVLMKVVRAQTVDFGFSTPVLLDSEGNVQTGPETYRWQSGMPLIRPLPL